MSTTLSTAPEPQALQTGLAIFDSGQFENLYRVAEALGKSSLIPASLKGKTEEETTANCLLVVEQSHRWRLSPFAVAQCASVVHGRLMWEGKLVHAVIQSLAGINLNYDISGTGEDMQVIVSGTLPGENEPRTIKGTVRQWKTTGNGSPWTKPEDHPRQLRYRGAREWSRAHNPAVMLGILTEDEDLPDMVNVTNGRTPAKRETPIVPGNKQADAEPYAATAMKDEQPTANVPTGRQKKERLNRIAILKGITERSGNGKTWWDVALQIGSTDVVMTTFSKTLHGSLLDCEKGTKLWITFTKNEKGYALEDYSLHVADEEGGLV